MTRETDLPILVTGATDGIGRETARALVRHGVLVIVHGRDAARLAAVHDELSALAGRPQPAPLVGELGSFAAIRAMAAELERRGDTPAVLINNAGVYMKQLEKSADGVEMTFAVNHLAPFLLTHLVLAGPAGARLRRIVNVSSIAHARGGIDLADPQRLRKRFDSYASYAASKLANVLFTVELARRLQSRAIAVNALHPGVVSTKLLTEGFEMHGPDSLAEGSATSLMLAIDPAVDGVTGRYFMRQREAEPNPKAADRAYTRAFYELSAGLVGVEPLPEP